MYQKRTIRTIAAFFIFALAVLPFRVWASASGAVNFSVKAVLPDNQRDTGNTYFDLRMTPGQKQTLTVIVYNNSESELQAHTSVISASTSKSGLIDYNTPGVQDESLRIPFSHIAGADNEILTIPPASSREATVTIQMPDEAYDGVILGGIMILGQRPEDEEQASESLSIKNQYSYVIGVKLTETDALVRPDLHLKSVRPTLLNYHTAVSARLQNSEAAIIKGMSVSADIYRAGEASPLHHAEQKSVDMAPNSIFDFTVNWQGQKIEPGRYRLHLTAVHEEKIWQWDEEFTIEPDAANDTNQGSVDISLPGPPVWLYIAGGVGLLLIVLLLGYWLGRRKKKQTA